MMFEIKNMKFVINYCQPLSTVVNARASAADRSALAQGMSLLIPQHLSTKLIDTHIHTMKKAFFCDLKFAVLTITNFMFLISNIISQ